MEDQKQIIPQVNAMRRKLRSWSDDQNDHILTFKRTQSSIKQCWHLMSCFFWQGKNFSAIVSNYVSRCVD